MNKGIKALLMIAVVFLLSGCTEEYTLNFNKNLGINELAIVNVSREEFTSDKNDSLNSNLSDKKYYDDYVNNMTSNLESSIYTVLKDNDLNNGATTILKRDADSYVDFLDNNLLTGFFGNAKMTDGDLFTVYFSDVDSQTFVGDGAYVTYKINIKTPFVVINNNADSIDKRSNTYTWNYSAALPLKDLIISFDKNKTYHPSIFMLFGTEGMIMLTIGVIIGIIIFVYMKLRKINSIS